MTGRIYDAEIGVFLSADIFIQAPGNLQNYNRYSYVLNNPLSYTDPSGHFVKALGKFFKKFWRPIVAIAIAVVSAGVLGPMLAGALGFKAGTLGFAMTVGFVGGFAGGFAGALLAGGSLGQAFTAGLKGGAIGAAMAGLTHGLFSGGENGVTADQVSIPEIDVPGYQMPDISLNTSLPNVPVDQPGVVMLKPYTVSARAAASYSSMASAGAGVVPGIVRMPTYHVVADRYSSRQWGFNMFDEFGRMTPAYRNYRWDLVQRHIAMYGRPKRNKGLPWITFRDSVRSAMANPDAATQFAASSPLAVIPMGSMARIGSPYLRAGMSFVDDVTIKGYSHLYSVSVHSADLTAHQVMNSCRGVTAYAATRPELFQYQIQYVEDFIMSAAGEAGATPTMGGPLGSRFNEFLNGNN